MCVFMNVCAHGWVWVYLPMHRLQKKASDPLELQWWVPVEPQLVTQVLGIQSGPSPWLHSQGSELMNCLSIPYFYSIKGHLHTPCLDLIALWDMDGTEWLSWVYVYKCENKRAQKDKAPIIGVYCSMKQDVSHVCCYCKITKVWLSSCRSKYIRRYL